MTTMMQRSSKLAARVAAVCVQQPQPPRSIALFSSAANAGTGGNGSSSGADAASQPGAKTSDAKVTAASSSSNKKKKKSSPMQNLKDVMDALDIMIEEAEKKVVKKYRPNMFAEFKQLNDTNGKTLPGPEQLVDVSKAVAFPPLSVRSLVGKDVDLQSVIANSGKVTLVLTSFKNFGLNMLPAWREAFEKEFTGSKRVQTATLNIIEDWYMKLVQSSITRGLQEKTPAELHELTFAHFGRCDDFRTTLDLYNSFTGYAHLVDAKGRIRWIASGEATPEETERLVRVTRQLLEQSNQSRRR